MSYERLLALLVAHRSRGDVFNQYREVHPRLDLPQGAARRRRNLRLYLEAFSGTRFLLVGEAAGYAGCRFSGIPFTCEAQLAGHDALAWTVGKDLARSSSTGHPWVERSARMVWETLGQRTDCLLWNALPWHPFGSEGPLSNRPPGRDLYEGLEVLECLLSLFPLAKPYAVGRAAQRALKTVGVEAAYIRHPSHGGKRQFVEGVSRLGQGDRAAVGEDRSRARS